MESGAALTSLGSQMGKARRSLWRRWVVANGLGEMVGLGLSGALTVTLIMANESQIGPIVAALVTVVGCTLIEGTAVGVAQWRVLRVPLPQMPLRSWWIGTAAGALFAWTLGMLPSTVFNMMETAGSTTAVAATAGPEMSQGVTLLLAALLGAVAGPILGVGQWWVLRRCVARAWQWIPAQAAAWAVGMPLIFQLIDWIAPGAFTLRDALLAAAMLFLTGAVVGAIHGVVLARLVIRDSRLPNP